MIKIYFGLYNVVLHLFFILISLIHLILKLNKPVPNIIVAVGLFSVKSELW